MGGVPAGGMMLGAVQSALNRRMQRGQNNDQIQLAQQKMAQDSDMSMERNVSMLDKIKSQADSAMARAQLEDERKRAELKSKEDEANFGRAEALRAQSAKYDYDTSAAEKKAAYDKELASHTAQLKERSAQLHDSNVEHMNLLVAGMRGRTSVEVAKLKNYALQKLTEWKNQGADPDWIKEQVALLRDLDAANKNESDTKSKMAALKGAGLEGVEGAISDSEKKTTEAKKRYDENEKRRGQKKGSKTSGSGRSSTTIVAVPTEEEDNEE